MYLKSIEIQGFKSFANKIVFEFHNGITGIVGPNGSGKSNVADAVRWVLGEQRIKQLRGASRQDVIFSGTELRKPQGFAYVAITLDNSDHQLAIDYDQVTVSRRLYRSGESEYMINGSACRLKDINELFYDTGIGKEGYSIIGQGQIDKILSGKPEERRELFDEAAGIVKFKRRKAIAQKKLEDEEANLVRVRDILAELEKQVGPLERQSKAAREYLKLKEQLKICDANQFLMENGQIREQLAQTEEKKKILSEDLEASKGQEAQLKMEYDRLEEEISRTEAEMSSGREALNQETVLKGNLEGRINVLKEQIHTEEINQEHLESRRQAICSDLETREGQLRDYGAQRGELEVQGAQVADRNEEARKRLESRDAAIRLLEQQTQEEKSQIIGALNEKAGLNARQQRYEAMLEQVNLRRSEVSQKLLKYKSDESVQEEQIQKEQAALSEVEENLKETRTAITQTETELAAGEEEQRRLNVRLNHIQQEYHTSYTKLESLRNLAERYEGYGGSIRRVMEVRDRIHGIHGVVADLIAVEQKYETAIETALGGSIQNIVTDSEETAKRLIEYLKKNRYGRATFLPLTSVKNRQGFQQKEVLKEPGVLGLASQLVETKDIYRELIGHLLGRVVVADTIDHAIALARKYRYSLRIVTLEGELLSAGGSMTGGAFKNSSNLLGRRRELEELEEACKKAIGQVEQVQKEIHMREELQRELKEQLEAQRGKLQKLTLEENTIQLNISRLEDKKQEIAGSYEDLSLEHGQLEEQGRDISNSRKQLEEEMGALEEKSALLTRKTEEQDIRLEEEKRLRGEEADELSKVQLEMAGLKQKLDFLQENENRVKSEIRRLKEEFAGLDTGKESSERAVWERRTEIGRMEEEIRSAVLRMGELEKEIAGKAQEKEKMAKQQKGFFARREEISARLSALDKDLFRIQAQEEKLEERLEQSASYMWSEYELTFSTAQELRSPEYDSLPELKRQIDGLKGSIKALGNVNVNAIEDYREVSERYEFMKTQHEDLTAARAELEKIILELDSGMRRQFSEKFGQIQAEFDKVFKELFGGGRGTLELMEGEDLLEAGIQIIAQPPGKKLQNMMQLSGGEKALTAISLLFAIQNLKPSPFCLLDEIEAALDDSNVDRFAGYLHKLTKNTQFIVITHRRGTMVSADRLYGITMQEKGVSTLVSVNLIEAELDK